MRSLYARFAHDYQPVCRAPNFGEGIGGGNGQTPPLPPLYEIEIVGAPSNNNIGLFAHEARARWPSFHVNGHGGWVANLSEDDCTTLMALAPKCGVSIHITMVAEPVAPTPEPVARGVGADAVPCLDDVIPDFTAKNKEPGAKDWFAKPASEPHQRSMPLVGLAKAPEEAPEPTPRKRPIQSNAQDARIDTDSPDFKVLAARALEHVDVILPKLFPKGKVWEGNEFHLLNPHRNDHSLGTFSINMGTGKWADFSPAAGAGVKGSDLISFVRYYFGLDTQHEAAAGLDQMLDVGLFNHEDAPEGPDLQPLTEAELKAGKAGAKARSRRQSRRDNYGPSIPAPAETELDIFQGCEGYWPYFDGQGRILMYVTRKSAGPGTPKHFFPYSYREITKGSGRYQWVSRDPDGPLPLYRSIN